MTEAQVRLLSEPAGIGGWLVLPLIGLILFPLRMAYSVFVNMLPSFESELWNELTTPGTDLYSSYWAPYLITSLVLYVGLAAWAVVLVVLFVQRRRRVPSLITMFFVGTAVVALFDFVSLRHLASQVPLLGSALSEGATRDLVQSLIAPAIWVPYFRVSVRVKNTFDR